MKKQLFRKPLALLLALMLVVVLLPMTASATDLVTVTVRIEGNGLGTDGINTEIGTVLSNTVVTLSAGATALDAVNQALQTNELDTASGSDGYYNAFGGVSGTSSASWVFMLNDAYSSTGLDSTTISDGANIVMNLAEYSSTTGTYTTGYSYFKTVSTSSDVQWGYAYGEVTLALYNMTNTGWNPDYSPQWAISAVPDSAIYLGASQAYTPDGALAVTDYENGVATIALWGGTTAGTYYFDIKATVNGSTNPHCCAKMVYDGTNDPIITFSQPSAANTTLSALFLTFPGVSAMNGLPYMGGNSITVDNAVDSVIVTAAASDTTTPATVTATFRAAGESAASTYTPGDSTTLAIGGNTFKFTVTNGTDTQIHTLIITREAAATRDIPAEVTAVIGGVKTVPGDAPYTDWILAMRAAGLTVSDAQLDTYFAAILAVVDDFVDSGIGSVGTMAKHTIALTSLGIDARQIPDPDGGTAIDLVSRIASYTGTVDPVYAAPYILSLYDLGNYSVPADASITRAGLIVSILSAQNTTSNLWTSADGTGLVLSALAPYYNATTAVNGVDVAQCDIITMAINNAVTALSNAQAIDGGMGTRNSNTTATVITGINAIGISPHTDARFVKSGSTLLTDLLSFRTSDDKLGYNSNTSANTMACYQGFQALATYQNLTNGTRNSNLYHFTSEIAPYTAWPNAHLLTGIAVTTQPTNKTYNYNVSETACAPNTIGLVVTATYNADALDTAIIPISDCTVSTIDCSIPGTKTVTVTYQGKTATFMVTVLNGDSSTPVQKTVGVTVRSNSSTIADGTVVIQENVTSVLDVLKTVLSAAGKIYVIRNETYVASIDGLGEFDQGANSGWLYSVNGVTPPITAAGNYLLTGGDVVLYYYTLNYTTDTSSSEWTSTVKTETLPQIVMPTATVTNAMATATVTAALISDAIDAAKENGVSAITILPSIDGNVSKVNLTVQKSAIRDIVNDTDAAVVLNTPVGSVELGNGALESIMEQAGGSDIIFSIETKTAADVDLPDEDLENSFIVAVSITSGGKIITQFGGNVLNISLPVDDSYIKGETCKIIVVSADDSKETLWGKVVDVDGKITATVTATHLSIFIVTDEKENVFTDVAQEAWYADAVRFVVAKNLFNGTDGDTFSPDADMTRAMLATVLYRLDGKPAVTAANTYADVENGAWYADAIIWACENGIVKGMGDGLFGTSIPVTRQEMATMLCRYAKYKGCDMTKTTGLAAYEETASIAGWAFDAMDWANAEGLIIGVTGTALVPNGNASRATVATILMRFVENVVK